MRLSVAGFLFVVAGGCAFAQAVISAHSGVVQYVEGRAFLDGQPVDLKFGHFPDIKNNQEFRTEDGRAEVLLTPGVFLRLGEDSGIRMLSNGLDNTRVEVIGGSAIVECDQVPKDNAITLVYKENRMMLQKHGLYRVDTKPARFEVYDGEAVVKNESEQVMLRSGKETELDGALSAQTFDKKDSDELYNWANRRSSYVAQANVSSASAVNNGGFGYGYDPAFAGLGYGLGYGGYTGLGLLGGGWSWNPLFGMFTMVPLGGMFYSPFGYPFYSPATVAYAPAYGGNVFNHSAIGSNLASRAASLRAASAAPAMMSAGGAAHAGGFGHAGGGHGR